MTDRRLRLVYAPRDGCGTVVGALAEAATNAIELVPTSDPAALRAAVRTAVDDGVDRLLVGGGDGTVRDVVDALAPDFPPIELALLPMGTGNDLARSLGLNRDLREVVEIALCGGAVAADAVRLTADDGAPRFFANVANVGFGGVIATRVDSPAKARWGPFAYWMSTLGSLGEAPAFDVELTLDEEPPRKTTVCALALANGRFLGGGFPVAREARLDDGLLDLTWAAPLEAGEFLRAGMDFAFGRESDNPHVRTGRAGTVRVRSEDLFPLSLDGDPMHVHEACLSPVPGALRIVAAPGAAAFEKAPSLWTETKPGEDPDGV